LNLWRCLIETEPRAAAMNMAVDQRLLELIEQGLIDTPVLRVYAWAKPTLSLGYHQQWRRTVVPDALERHDIDLVRRWTGGRAVLHDFDEITYAVAAPMSPPFANRIKPNYCLIGKALNRFADVGAGAVAAMAAGADDAAEAKRMRHAPCFASLSQAEIEVAGKKLIGSSQKLGKRGFLQHGSIPLISRPDVLQDITGSPLPMGALMSSLEERYRQAGRELPPRTALVERLVHSFAEAFAARFEPLAATGVSVEPEAARLAAERFLRDDWTFRK